MGGVLIGKLTHAINMFVLPRFQIGFLKQDKARLKIVLGLALILATVHSQGVTIDSLAQQLYARADTLTNDKFELDVQTQPVSPELKITSLGQIVLTEKLNSTNNPYLRIVERFSTNGYSSYEIGGKFDGKNIANEGRLDYPQPVIGTGLFANSFYQGYLLTSLTNATISESEYEGEQVYIIAGGALLFQMPINFKLVFSKQDALLLEQDMTMTFTPKKTTKTIKLKAQREIKTPDAVWPYSSMSSETWFGDKLSQKTIFTTSFTHEKVNSGEQIPPLVFPDHTLVSNQMLDRTYDTGPKRHISAAEMLKMQAQHKILERNIKIFHTVILAVFIVPLLVILFVRMKKRLQKK